MKIRTFAQAIVISGAMAVGAVGCSAETGESEPAEGASSGGEETLVGEGAPAPEESHACYNELMCGYYGVYFTTYCVQRHALDCVLSVPDIGDLTEDCIDMVMEISNYECRGVLAGWLVGACSNVPDSCSPH